MYFPKIYESCISKYLILNLEKSKVLTVNIMKVFLPNKILTKKKY